MVTLLPLLSLTSDGQSSYTLNGKGECFYTLLIFKNKEETKMFSLLFTIGLVVLGIWIESKYRPRLRKEPAAWFVYYDSSKGSRNKKKLF